ncbi:hypothetical protein [Avibacterium paragallinarum]|uniref:Putative assembly protein n=1 Tax=Avibacterium paragallinarum TaxID=728 RepID=A0A380X5A6_AVIPA|nr:hypothetical protein [Avibacterium paragallinarum]KAA6208192.1 hypothetical protein F1968_10670 [Avibacterium paragallinarum]RZN55538.1 hypothetical protein EIG79_11285 [Avibacterium paragallinarum]RZN68883.1 hypothetical protein EIG77_10750 [Avibacterium paragallinarum]SUU98422.1 putative assembly protein [Avibacterium paragallinarum]
MKKKALVLISILLAGLCFLFWQKSHLNTQLSTYLAENRIQVVEVESHLFPTQLSLHQVQFQQNGRWFFFEKIVLDVNMKTLLSGDIQLNEIQLYNGGLADSQWKILNLNLKPIELSWQYISHLFTALSQDIPLNLESPVQMAFSVNMQNLVSQMNVQGKFQLLNNGLRFNQLSGQWRFEHPIYGDMDKMVFRLKQGNLYNEIQDYKHYYGVSFDDFFINEIPFQQGKILIDFQPHLIKGKGDFLSQGSLDFEFSRTQPHLQVSAQNIALEQWLALFKLPALVIGKTNLNGEMYFSDLQIDKGRFNLEVMNGKMKNINLFSIITRDLPINYEQQNVQNDSPFEQLTATLSWDKQKMQWQDLQLRDRYFQLTGQGIIEQNKQQCDFLVTLNLREKKYQNFRLPLHFFGDCHSPQYQIGSPKELKKQLKDLLKQHFH